jgi:hypothetical protein
VVVELTPEQAVALITAANIALREGVYRPDETQQAVDQIRKALDEPR